VQVKLLPQDDELYVYLKSQPMSSPPSDAEVLADFS
jgi:hypothetical protein